MGAVHPEGTQPCAEWGIQACCSHGAGQEAPGRVVTAVSPISGGTGGTRAHADATRAESGKRGRGLPFTRSSACSCNNCCCRISNCLCSSSNCRLMYSWRHGQQGSKEKEREGKKEPVFPERKENEVGNQTRPAQVIQSISQGTLHPCPKSPGCPPLCKNGNHWEMANITQE